MDNQYFDLFGEPLTTDRGPGRPAFAWTLEKSNRVNMLFACGYEPKAVAPVIGCCLKTFRKVFSRECRERATAHLRFRSVQLMRLNIEASKGNVTAEKALAAMIQAEHVKAIGSKIVDRRADPKPAALGKKEAARQAAGELGGRFGTRTPPVGQLIN